MMSPEVPEKEPLVDAPDDAFAPRASAAERVAEMSALRCADLLEELALQYRERATRPLPTDPMPELRACVTEYALALRTLGLAPEAAVIRIKQSLHRVTHPPGRGFTAELMQIAMTWAIEAYYRQ